MHSPNKPRSPWQLFYGAVHRWRRRWWAERAERLPRLVISIGNLHWGGTGKTPLTAAVAAHLHADGRRVAILSRGYGRSTTGPLLVSDGSGPRVSPAEGGDEPVELARRLPDVAVLVAEKRADAGRLALETLEPPPDVFLLDDGFSHVYLARDVDVLVFPAVNPLAGGRLFPGGRLREPLASARHADAVILTGVGDEATPEAARELAEALRAFGFIGSGFSAHQESEAPRLSSGESLAPGNRMLLVSGIARPERFADAARRVAGEAGGEGSGFDVVDELFFPDHHAYPESSLERIATAAREHGADIVLTTAKDEAKLAGRLTEHLPGVPLAVLPVTSRPEETFWNWLEERLPE